MKYCKDKRGTSVDEGINLLFIATKIWNKKKFIIKVTAIGGIMGLIIAFSIPKEYTTTIILTPDSHSSIIGTSMGSLASLAGININGTDMGDALASPELYPDILQSTPFIKGLLDVYIKDSKAEIDTTLYSYIKDYQSEAWWNIILKIPGTLKGLIRTEDTSEGEDTTINNLYISLEDQQIMDNLKNRFTINTNKKTNATTITVTMQSPEVSAYIADTLALYLQTYIIEYRTQKARKDLEYTEKLYKESQASYYKSQKELAIFIDRNINVVSAQYKTTQEKLQNEVNLTYSIYNQMAQQLQIAKVKVQDTTPVFTIIQPAIQPLIPSKPSKKILFIGFIFLAFTLSCIWIIKEEIWTITRKAILGDLDKSE